MATVEMRSTSFTILGRVQAIREAAMKGSRAASWAINDIRMIVERDNEEKLFRSVDRFGRPLARLAASTLKRRKSTQNILPLIPHGFASRTIQNFRTEVRDDNVIVASWDGIPWLRYHLEGGRRLPQRDIAGVTPEGHELIGKRLQQFAKDVGEGKK